MLRIVSVYGRKAIGNPRSFSFLVVLSFFLPFLTIHASAESPKNTSTLYSQLPLAIFRIEKAKGIECDGSNLKLIDSVSAGSGFFVSYKNKLFAVTARHVAEKREDLWANIQVGESSGDQKRVFTFKLPGDAWQFHDNAGDDNTWPVDVAAMKVRVLTGEYYSKYFLYNPENPDNNQLSLNDFKPPLPIINFGYPLGMGQSLSKQQPLARQGIISICAGEPFIRRTEKTPTGNITKYLNNEICVVDLRAFKGNSGSPIIRQILPLIYSDIRLVGLVVTIPARDKNLDYAVMEPVSHIRETTEKAYSVPIEETQFWYSPDIECPASTN